MDKIYYINNEKTAVPYYCGIPTNATNVLEVDLKEIGVDGNILPYIEWTSEGITTDIDEAKSNLNIDVKLKTYNNLVVSKIRVNYSQDDEFSMIAEGIADATNDSYVAYRAFVATCKAEANTEVYGS